MLVSIPNGMEFYDESRSTLYSNTFVSIHNGMEFYPRSKRAQAAQNCFNSQRDGILQESEIKSLALEIVSIPNGMEFYKNYGDQKLRRRRVSIPNGMEFYAQP